MNKNSRENRAKTEEKRQNEEKRNNEIIRIEKKRNNFVMLDKGFIEDERLSYKAKGILTYLLSKPDNWKVIVKDLVNHSKDGKKAVYSGLRELKEYGYYRKVPVRDEDNKVISHWESVIYESPPQEPDQDDPNPPQKKKKPADPEEKGEKSPISSLLTPFVHIDNVEIQNEEIQNGQRNNINISKNNLTNNDVSIYQGEPENEIHDDQPASDKPTDKINTVIKIYTPEQVADKISLPELKDKYADRHDEVDMLYNTVCDVLADPNPTSPTYRISKQNFSLITVKNTFDQLQKEHIEYVIDCLAKNGNKYNINKNPKSYLMTSLFHSVRTISYYYNRNLKKPGFNPDDKNTESTAQTAQNGGQKSSFNVDQWFNKLVAKSMQPSEHTTPVLPAEPVDNDDFDFDIFDSLGDMSDSYLHPLTS